MDLEQDISLPALRQDLKVFEGGYDLDGAPTLMMYDPLADNYFKIGWFEFECLQRFEQCETGNELCIKVSRETTLNPDIEDVKELVSFLMFSGLLVANQEVIQQSLHQVKDSRQTASLRGFITRNVFMNIPLFEPEDFLKATYPYIKFLFTRSFLIFVMGLLAVGIYLTVQRFDDFIHTFSSFMSFEGLVLVILTTVFVKFFHELGHAFMAHKYNIPVPTMGVVLVVFYPILYTETTNAWRLEKRKKRVHIASAGLMAEMTLAAFALIFWHILSPGFWQNAAYFIAFVSFGISVLVNMNPLMKFDGYYLLSDIMGIDNLQARAISFFKLNYRKFFLGLEMEKPENLRPQTERFLTTFGYALIIYRFFLFMSIGFAVYFFFFKPLGLIMMIAVIFIFMGIPILKELIFYFTEREQILKNIKGRIVLGFLCALLCLAFLPLDTKIKVPGVLHAKDYASLYAPVPAEIAKFHVQNGDQVQKGDILVSLESRDLEIEIQKSLIQLNLFFQIKEREQGNQELARKGANIDQLILEAQTKLAGLQEQKDKLEIKSPFSGFIRDISPDLHEQRAVNKEDL